MELSVATITKAGAVVTGIGVLATGAWKLAAPAVVQELDARHALRSDFEQHRMEANTQAHVNAIQGWVRAAREEGTSEYICDAIQAELIELCSEVKDHYLCSDKARTDTLRRAGCQ